MTTVYKIASSQSLPLKTKSEKVKIMKSLTYVSFQM